MPRIPYFTNDDPWTVNSNGGTVTLIPSGPALQWVNANGVQGNANPTYYSVQIGSPFYCGLEAIGGFDPIVLTSCISFIFNNNTIKARIAFNQIGFNVPAGTTFYADVPFVAPPPPPPMPPVEKVPPMPPVEDSVGVLGISGFPISLGKTG